MIPAEIGNIIIYSLALLPFLLLSAFFSGTETAFFSLNSLERENLKLVTRSRWKNHLMKILAHPDDLLVTILTGNMLVNVFATDFFASHVVDTIATRIHLPEVKLFSLLTMADLFSIVVMTLLILIFGEMTPKNLAVRHPVAFARFAVLPLYFTEKFFKPFTFFLKRLQARLMHRFSGEVQEDEKLKNELLSLTVQIGYRENMLNKFELDLFESYLEFRNKAACDVMIPRTELRGIDISTSLEEVLALAAAPSGQETAYLYVYKKDFDHIVGYIDLGDLLPYRYGLKPSRSLKKLVKPFYSIPETKCLNDLVAELAEQNRELAHVVDEYGGTAGIITFQHLIEDLFDHFYDSTAEIHAMDQGWYRVPGTLEVGELEELLDLEFASEMRTVSGMIIESMGEIPEAGRRLTLGEAEFSVNRATKKRIVSLDVRKA